MGFWAKFEGGGRQAHYFKSDKAVLTLCARMPITGTVSKILDGLEERRKCKKCRQQLAKIREGASNV